MLVSMNSILPKARREGYAVPAFDAYSDVYSKAVIKAAREVRSPVILMMIPDYADADEVIWLSESVKGIARHYDLPIALHLDHASSFEQCKAAIESGFSSVMIDASTASFEDNIRKTREVADYAHRYGVSVEAELGFVAGVDVMGNDTGDTKLTDPVEVEEFVAKTDVDALAVSIGTAHGVYVAEPVLNIEQLKKINAVSKVPLVLHGGSGTPTAQVQNAIKNGIAKINIFAEMRQASGEVLMSTAEKATERVDPLPEAIFEPIEEALVAKAKSKMMDFYSAGKI